MNELDADRNPVEVLADEFSSRLRRGERPSVAEYCERYPQLAQEIRDLFPSIVMMERLKLKEKLDFESAQQRNRVAGRRLERLGDYEIIREIGRGGMGVVFEAVQASLGRTVALKVLSQNATASERQVQRFEREARAAGRLHHTNIVPVFGVGHEDDLHFYVMQYIEGVGLDQVLMALKLLAEERGTGMGTRGMAEADPHDASAVMLAEALCRGSFAEPRRNDSSSRDSARETRRTLAEGSTVAVSEAVRGAPADSFSGGSLSPSSAAPSATPSAAQDVMEVERAVEQAEDEVDTTSFGSEYFKSVARLGLQAAEALEYAHGQGIFHRDIKPGNLLLDAGGTVWMTDFGLAKLAEHQDLTRTGDIIGTLRYMAPEQFDGRSDARSDIYSLGLTLYEFLTLRPACDDTAIKQLLDQRSRDSMLRPRSVNPSIPRDLETIVLKAVSVDPDARYGSAGELAEDLHRFLEDRPVLARRATTVERLWRWSRRNPALASLSTTALVLAASLFCVLSLAYYRADRQRRQVMEANARAEMNLQVAVRAFDNIIENIGSRGIPQSFEMQFDEEEPLPRFETVVTAADAELLQGLLGFFDDFARRNSANLQVETARAYRRVGDIQKRLGRWDEAIQKYRDALDLYTVLHLRDPLSPAMAVARAGVLSELADAEAQSGDYRAAIGYRQMTRDFLMAQRPEVARHAEVRFALAEAHLALVPRYVPRGRSRARDDPPNRDRGDQGSTDDRSRNEQDQARAASRNDQAQEVASDEQDSSRDVQASTERSSSTRGSRPGRSRSGSDLDSWRNSVAQAEALLDQLLEEAPRDPEYRLAMARCSLAEFLLHWYGREEESARCDRAVVLLENLVSDFPTEPSYRFELADTLSIVSLAAPDRDESVPQLERALSMAQELVRQFPHVPDYDFLLANCQIRLASVQVEAGETEESIRLYQDAATRLRTLVARFPRAVRYQFLLTRTYRDLIRVFRRQGNTAAALETAQYAVQILAPVAEVPPQSRFAQRELGGVYYELAELLEESGREEEAAAARESSRRLFGGGSSRSRGDSSRDSQP